MRSLTNNIDMNKDKKMDQDFIIFNTLMSIIYIDIHSKLSPIGNKESRDFARFRKVKVSDANYLNICFT